jgi:hypothetical protein
MWNLPCFFSPRPRPAEQRAGQQRDEYGEQELVHGRFL